MPKSLISFTQLALRSRFTVATTVVVLLLANSSCSRTNPKDLPEWTPGDHANVDKPAQGQVDTSKARPGMSKLEQQGVNDVILATWKQNCVPCHGVIGRGDGPQAKVFHPPDLTNPQWQKNAIDSEIRFTLKKGKGRMPAFAHLPEQTVTGLIKLVRMLGRQQKTVEPKSAATPENLPSPAPKKP